MAEFRSVMDFPRGTLEKLLIDAYSFDSRCRIHWGEDWREFDDFFYDYPAIAERCGLITALHGVPIGFASWDPRNQPAFAVMGHNCIAAKYKRRGYGHAQMMEAVRRIRLDGARSVIVTTSELTYPAQRNYESVGFVRVNTRVNDGADAFAGDYIDYRLDF